MASPAQMPNACSPSASRWPSTGSKTIPMSPSSVTDATANTTSPSSASITGAVATMAVPPQMAVPMPNSVPSLPESFSHRVNPHINASAKTISKQLIATPTKPNFRMATKSSRAPSRMMPSGSNFLTEYLTPGRNHVGSVQTLLNPMPRTMDSITGSKGWRPPDSVNGQTGKSFSNIAATVSSRQTNKPQTAAGFGFAAVRFTTSSGAPSMQPRYSAHA